MSSQKIQNIQVHDNVWNLWLLLIYLLKDGIGMQRTKTRECYKLNIIGHFSKHAPFSLIEGYFNFTLTIQMSLADLAIS